MTGDLRTIQRRFFELITAPVEVAKALDPVAEHDPEAKPLSGWIDADSEAMATERLDVYANMYYFRLEDTLKDDFPKVLALIGPDRFRNLATDYVHAHPPRDPSLRDFGRLLADCLETHVLAEQWPHLADLARLEWSWVDVFDAEDAPALAVSALAEVAPERWPSLTFSPRPAVRTLRLQWPVTTTWGELHGGTPPSRLSKAPTTVLMWRREFRVFHRPLDGLERSAWEALGSGEPFEAVCAAIVDADPRLSVEEAAAKAAGFLRRWIEDEVLASGLPNQRAASS